MLKYIEILQRTKQSIHYWTQVAMGDFVTAVLARMESREMSRADLAKRLEVSPAYISKVMRGDANFTLESMVKLARALGGRLRVDIVDEGAVAAANKVTLPAQAAIASVSHEQVNASERTMLVKDSKWVKLTAACDEKFDVAKKVAA
jgi:transcriptional regulator with XRE-family HTH domain